MVLGSGKYQGLVECLNQVFASHLSQLTYENYADDVLIITPQGETTVHLLGSEPGEILQERQPIYPERVEDIWYRMPDVSYLPNYNL